LATGISMRRRSPGFTKTPATSIGRLLTFGTARPCGGLSAIGYRLSAMQ
jgi:hypothetical protein